MEEQAAKQVTQGMSPRLVKLAATLAKLDTLTEAERRELLRAWEHLGARWRTIHAMLRESVTPRRPRPPGPRPSPQDDALLTVPEVAAHLRVSVSRAYQLIRSKALPSVKIGERQVRVRQSTLQTYLTSHGTGKGPQS